MCTKIKYFDIKLPAHHFTLHGVDVLSILATQSEGQEPVASALFGYSQNGGCFFFY